MIAPDSGLRLAPAMPRSVPRGWPGAIWIGQLEHAVLGRQHLQLLDAEGYTRARLLITHNGVPMGFVELPVVDSRIDLLAQQRAAGELPPVVAPVRRSAELPAISVVLCTRDRPALLADALSCLARLDYPEYEVLVVDNNPTSGITAPVIGAHGWPELRLLDAPVPGLARARNVGVRAARHELIAFTDDDVLIDPGWLRGIAAGFGSDPTVGCVTGIVPSGEVNSLPQWYFDQRVSWARNCRARRFSMTSPPPDSPMFPFAVGEYGTGANFALRRSALFGIGGFDERLGAGSPTGGGEDIDIFVRVLLAGYDLVYQPDALVWHRHRAELADLTRQARDYGRGLGAWLTTLLTNPRTAALVARRAAAGVSRLRSFNQLPMTTEQAELLGELGGIERRGVLTGPAALARARLRGARARPLARQPEPADHPAAPRRVS